MPQAIAVAAQYVGMTIFQLASAAGASVSTAATIANIAAYATQIGLQFVTLTALNAVLNRVPSPDAGKQTLKQAIPPRITGYGECRIAGSYMLFESKGGDMYQISALHHGRVDAFTHLYLHDTEVFQRNPGAGDYHTTDRDDGAYGERVWIETRLGLTPETAYARPVAELPAHWTANHRGDNIASMFVWSAADDAKHQGQTFPQGLVSPSAAMRCSLVYDWRDTAQDRDDPATWVWSDNPVVCLADYLTNDVYGMALDWGTRIAPVLELWTDAADYCDELVDTKESGQIPRYRCGGWFYHGTAGADVVARLLECFDGWLSSDGQGHLVIFPGQYVAPGEEETLTRGDVVDFSFTRYVEDEQATNSVIVSFTSPGLAFTEVETDPWKDQDDIEDRGAERSAPLPLLWVQHNNQARRLAKRAVARGLAPRGTTKTNLGGLRLLGKRYARLPADMEVAFLRGLAIEIQKVEIDITGPALEFTWVAADENIDAFNPETEEGDGPTTEERVPDEALTAPDILGVDVIFETVSTGGQGARLLVYALGPDRADLLWFVRWRVSGQTSWNEESVVPEFSSDGEVALRTGFVPADELIEYEAAYETASSLSPWSDLTSDPADTSTADLTPGPATAFSVAPGAAVASAVATWRNPVDSTFASARVFRSMTNNFADAVDVTGAIAGAPGEVKSGINITTKVGNYFWVLTYNAAGDTDSSTGPYGPVAVDYMDARTDKLGVNSNDFNAWGKDSSAAPAVSPVVTVNTVMAPDGTMTADSVVFSRGAGTFSRLQVTSTGLSAGVQYDEDIWMKAPAAGLNVSMRIGGNNGVALNLTTEWVRYRLTAAAAGTSDTPQILLFSSISGSPQNATVHLWGGKFSLH